MRTTTTNTTATTNNKAANKNWRYGYGVVVDTLGIKHERLNSIRKQLRAKGYVGIKTAVENETIRYQQNGWAPDAKKLRNNFLRKATDVVFFCRDYSAIKSDVATAMYANTPVWIVAQVDNFNTVHPTSIDEWYAICNEEAAARKDYAVEQSLLQDLEEARYSVTALLNSNADWITNGRLHTFTRQFKSVEQLKLHMSSVKAEVNELGTWDTELSTTLLQVERPNAYSYISTKGEDKGRRVWGSSTNYSTWDSYEVTLADEINEFLSLSYYKAAGIKPLQKVMVDEDGSFVHKKGEELMSTPIYFEEEHVDDSCPLEDTADYDKAMYAINRVGVDELANMNYEDAKAIIKRIMNRR